MDWALLSGPGGWSIWELNGKLLFRGTLLECLEFCSCKPASAGLLLADSGRERLVHDLKFRRSRDGGSSRLY